MNRILKILRLVTPYALVWVVALACMFLFTLCNTISVMGLVPLIDGVLSRKPIRIDLSLSIPFQDRFNALLERLNGMDPLLLLNWICVFLLAVTLVKGLCHFIQEVCMEWISQRISRDLRIRIFEKYFLLPFHFFSGARTGELISRITLDVNLIQVIFSARFSNTLVDSLHFFPFLAIVLLIDWKMTLICTLVIPLALLPIVLIGRQIRKISHKTQQNIADISSHIFEVLGAMKIIKIFGQKNREQDRFDHLCRKTVQVRVRAQKKQAILSPITEMIGIATGVFLVWWFAPNVLDGKMSLGVFMTYITCIACMIKPLKTFGKIQIMLQNALAGLDRIEHLLNSPVEPSELAGDIAAADFRERIVFDRVRFGYDPEHPVLKDISFEINKGEVVALVGPSGSGKTTIANLLPRFFDPQNGRVLLDGVDVKNIRAGTLRGIIGMVTQEPVLFNATVAENIAYARPDASLEEIERVAKFARAHEFIMKMDRAYRTPVGERGCRLSGGEKQRIAIARALLRNPELVIFDEATSALDADNEKKVQEAIDRVMEDRTVLVIAHRLSTVVKAHKIIVIDRGEIVQSGTHRELMQMKGLYKSLYEMNFVS